MIVQSMVVIYCVDMTTMNKIEEILLKHWKLQDMMAGKIPTGNDCRAMIRDAFEEAAKIVEERVIFSERPPSLSVYQEATARKIRKLGG